ncbi:hypothetical protein C8F04DRAFT_1198082 [Mycena alexandri]|uniref:Uncharacterized protein n=1 Tax=Mycena alexandri TaxID=1745969 RepID=A0AAD6S152_9AGAR|nr:hypothetical protein C8F04DRAFT_1198082 [Mycena alexandri]
MSIHHSSLSGNSLASPSQNALRPTFCPFSTRTLFFLPPTLGATNPLQLKSINSKPRREVKGLQGRKGRCTEHRDTKSLGPRLHAVAPTAHARVIVRFGNAPESACPRATCIPAHCGTSRLRMYPRCFPAHCVRQRTQASCQRAFTLPVLLQILRRRKPRKGQDGVGVCSVQMAEVIPGTATTRSSRSRLPCTITSCSPPKATPPFNSVVFESNSVPISKLPEIFVRFNDLRSHYSGNDSMQAKTEVQNKFEIHAEWIHWRKLVGWKPHNWIQVFVQSAVRVWGRSSKLHRKEINKGQPEPDLAVIDP